MIPAKACFSRSSAAGLKLASESADPSPPANMRKCSRKQRLQLVDEQNEQERLNEATLGRSSRRQAMAKNQQVKRQQEAAVEVQRSVAKANAAADRRAATAAGCSGRNEDLLVRTWCLTPEPSRLTHQLCFVSWLALQLHHTHTCLGKSHLQACTLTTAVEKYQCSNA